MNKYKVMYNLYGPKPFRGTTRMRWQRKWVWVHDNNQFDAVQQAWLTKIKPYLDDHPDQEFQRIEYVEWDMQAACDVCGVPSGMERVKVCWIPYGRELPGIPTKNKEW